ncbi:hypothetical protein H5410_046610 [Solanum commersonii]|uniref:Translation initiation factor IF- 2 domain-containing protein n=1 Tax=Solanum commersonii TaxID=4109 RepID=A0A9J5XGY2_SOLCO|nr:hypothetical protein H5410_046610 [Solanum commersonii]
MEDMKSVMSKIDKSGEGVNVQETTLGSLEAFLEFFKTPRVSIPVSGIGIGLVHKKDVIKASVMLEKKKEYATILAFDVKAFTLVIYKHIWLCFYWSKKIEELELKKKQQETKAIETSRKAIPSMENCKKQLMIANSDFMEKWSIRIVSTISSETCYEVGDNMMNYSTGNKKTTLIKLNDVPYNVGEGFLPAPISRQTTTTITTVTPHELSSPVKGVKMSKAKQASGDDRASQVSISRKEYGHQQARKYCSSSATSLPQRAASWLVLATLRHTASDESII